MALATGGAGVALGLILLPLVANAAGAAALVLKTKSGPHRFAIELATTDEERKLGLMYRRSLAADTGMLFLYDSPQPIAMWMKNTFIPLDMIFIGPDFRVSRIEKHAEPFSTDVISSEGEVIGVLEVAAGTADAIDLKPGDALIYPAPADAKKP